MPRKTTQPSAEGSHAPSRGEETARTQLPWWPAGPSRQPAQGHWPRAASEGPGLLLTGDRRGDGVGQAPYDAHPKHASSLTREDSPHEALTGPARLLGSLSRGKAAEWGGRGSVADHVREAASPTAFRLSPPHPLFLLRLYFRVKSQLPPAPASLLRGSPLTVLYFDVRPAVHSALVFASGARLQRRLGSLPRTSARASSSPDVCV